MKVKRMIKSDVSTFKVGDIIKVKLTDEEMACIRWHMGAFDDKENWDKYGKSIEKYPNVLWTHTADMMAARIYKI